MAQIFGFDLMELLRLTLWFILVAVAPEILIGVFLWNRMLAKRVRTQQIESVKEGEWDEVIERIVAPVEKHVEDFRIRLEGQVAQMDSKIEVLDQALGVKFTELEDALVGLPEKVRMSAIGAHGRGMRELYEGAEEAGEEIEAEVTRGMEPMDLALSKIETMQPSDAWKAKNPIGEAIVELGRAALKESIKGRRGIIATNREGSGGSPYPGI